MLVYDPTHGLGLLGGIKLTSALEKAPTSVYLAVSLCVSESCDTRTLLVTLCGCMSIHMWVVYLCIVYVHSFVDESK